MVNYETIPKVMTLCESTRFKNQFLEVNKKLTLEGVIVLMPGVFAHNDDEKLTPEQKERLDLLHKRKIDLSDGIFVINVNGYIGESTQSEIEYAQQRRKIVEYYEK
ncbi:hypothetical protein HYT23_02035 [Candidatus Pacearchaeota archaeon]|nr:hypothetical protein [Candidatus Pacearchaeota archaeon]